MSISTRIVGGVILLSIVAGVYLLFSNQLPTEPTAVEPDPPSPESLITFPNDAAKEVFLQNHNLNDDQLQQTNLDNNTYIAPIPSDTKIPESDGQVMPRRQYHALLTPNDPLHPQIATTPIAAAAAWDITTGANTTIAVLDTGFALDHEDMSNRWLINNSEFGSGKESNGVDDDTNGKIDDWRGWDFAQDDNNPNAGSTNPGSGTASHGTVVAGLVGGTGNNERGVASINWGANILPLQVLTDNGSGFTENVANAINYAVTRGAKVISMSLGTTSADPTVQNAINSAIDAGVTVVAAAGNCGDPNTFLANDCATEGQVLYPAKYSNVITVGASTSTDTRATFSSYGPEVDLLAPGAGVIRSPSWSQSNQTTAYTGSANGTSIATPIIAGAIGLLHSVQPNLTPSQISTILKFGIDKVPEMGGATKTDYHGYGRLHAWKALKFTLTPHPDGTLVKAENNPNVYLVEGGQLRLVGSPAILQNQGYQSGDIRVATIADLQLPTGSVMYFREGTLIRGSEPAVYAIDNDSGTIRKRHITSIATLQALGFTGAEIITVPNNELPAANGAAITNASVHPDGSIVRAQGSFDVYLIEGGQRRYISSPQVMQSHGFTAAQIKVATTGDGVLAQANNVDFREGTLLKDSNPAVYVIDNDSGTLKKRHVTSIEVYTLLSYSSDTTKVLTVPTAALPLQNGTLIQ